MSAAEAIHDNLGLHGLLRGAHNDGVFWNIEEKLLIINYKHHEQKSSHRSFNGWLEF